MEKKKVKSASNDSVSMPDEMLKNVSGGGNGFGDDLPFVPENDIDDDVKKKFSSINKKNNN